MQKAANQHENGLSPDHEQQQNEEFDKPLDVPIRLDKSSLNFLNQSFEQPSIQEEELNAKEKRDDDQSSVLNKKGRKSMNKNAQYPELIEKAKVFLQHNEYNTEKLLLQDEFKVLENSNDYKTYIIKFLKNEKSKQNRPRRLQAQVNYQDDKTETDSIAESLPSSKTQQSKVSQQEVVPLLKTPYGAISQNSNVNQEISSEYYKQYLTLQPLQRYGFFETMLLRNLESLVDFLKILKGYNNPILCNGVFTIVYELILSNKLSIGEQARLFTHALLFYNLERVQISEELTRRMMIELKYRPDIDQTLQFANLVFVNEISSFAKFELELIQLDQANIGIVPLMFSTFNHFGVDYQVSRQLPNSLLILNQPFIKMLKTNNGLDIIRNIDYSCLQDFIHICSFVNSPDLKTLQQFVTNTRTIYKDQWAMMDQNDFSLCLNGLKQQLQERNQLWVGQTGAIEQLLNDIVFVQINKNIKSQPDMIQAAVLGDMTLINQYKETPKEMKTLSSDAIMKLIKSFHKMNKDNQTVAKYCLLDNKQIFRKAPVLEELEQLLKFPFHHIQQLCLGYMIYANAQYQFFNVGIGNGKTVLSAAAAIYLSQASKCNVFIIGKNEYLTMRDQKRFETLITSFNLQTNLNKYNNTNGIYYYTQRQLEQVMTQKDFKELWKRSIVIIDEFDWIIFEGSPTMMHKTLKFISKCQKLVCFTGSQLKPIEQECLKSIFKTTSVVFPTLCQVSGEKKQHLQDEMINTKQQEYIERLKTLITSNIKSTPIIIVAGPTYEVIDQNLSKAQGIDLYSLKNNKSAKIDSLLKERFLERNQQGQFGVYLLNEALGRGTDFSTNEEIEQNGGLYEIIADVFTLRSQEQVIGRIGRLENRGRWHLVLYERGCNAKLDVHVKSQQQQWESEEHQKLQTLHAMITSKQNKNIKPKKESNQKENLSIQMPVVVEKEVEQDVSVHEPVLNENDNESQLPDLDVTNEPNNNQVQDIEMTNVKSTLALVKENLLNNPVIENEQQVENVITMALKQNQDQYLEKSPQPDQENKRQRKATLKAKQKGDKLIPTVPEVLNLRQLRSRVGKKPINYGE